MTPPVQVAQGDREALILKVGRAICAARLGGFCTDVGHDVMGCMVGYGEHPHWTKCKASDDQIWLTDNSSIAGAVIDLLLGDDARQALGGR